MGRWTGVRQKETKQKEEEEERQRVMKRSVAHSCQRKSLAVSLSPYLSQPLQLLWDPLFLVACEEGGEGNMISVNPE